MRRAALLPILLVLGLTTPLGGCALLQTIANRISPRVTSVDQQYTSVEQNLRQLQDFTPGVGAYVGKDLLLEAGTQELVRAISEADQSEVEVRQLSPSLGLVVQGLSVTATFDLVLREQRVRARGNLTGVVALSTDGDRLVLRPAFNTVNITRLERTEGGRVRDRVIASAARALVRSFVDNLNGKIAAKPVVIDLNWEETVEVDLAEMLGGNGTTVNAPVTSISKYLRSSVVRLDESGLWMMVALAEERNPVPEEEIPSTSTEQQRTPAELNALFRTFSREFDARWTTRLDPADRTAGIEVAVAKPEIAALLNRVMGQPLTITHAFTIPRTEFSETVEAKKSEVDCQRVREPFRRQRYERERCSWSCLKCINVFGRRVCTDEPGCLASRAACNAREEARVAADNVRHEAEQGAHNLLQESKVASCNVAREANNFLGVGRFSGHVQGSGSVRADLASACVAENLSQIDLDLAASMQGSAAVDLKITPHDLGHVFLCVAPHSTAWSSQIRAEVPRATQQVEISHRQDGNDLLLTATFPMLTFQASVSPPPLQSLVTDPGFQTRCSVGNAILFSGLGLSELATRLGVMDRPLVAQQLMGRFAQSQDIQPLTIRIEPIVFELGPTRKMMSEVRWGEKAIRLISRATPTVPAPM